MNLDMFRRNCALSPRPSASQTQSVVKASGGLATVVDWERYFSSFCGGLGNFFPVDWETF